MAEVEQLPPLSKPPLKSQTIKQRADPQEMPKRASWEKAQTGQLLSAQGCRIGMGELLWVFFLIQYSNTF